jgi:hypothetical protein
MSESIPKPSYLSRIVTYEDKTAIFHINFARIHLAVSFFFAFNFTSTVVMTS